MIEKPSLLMSLRDFFLDASILKVPFLLKEQSRGANQLVCELLDIFQAVALGGEVTVVIFSQRGGQLPHVLLHNTQKRWREMRKGDNIEESVIPPPNPDSSEGVIHLLAASASLPGRSSVQAKAGKREERGRGVCLYAGGDEGGGGGESSQLKKRQDDTDTKSFFA
jgi:hypothetical protein